MQFKDNINLLSIITAGIFAGGTLMIGVSFGLRWSGLGADELLSAFPSDWKNIATTIIPFALLQTVFIPLSLYFAWQNKPCRRLWISALVLWFANCTITSVYHFPVVLNALDAAYSVSDIAGVVSQWLWWHWPRVLLGFATFFFTILAALRSNQQG
jgi:hypothetical protein